MMNPIDRTNAPGPESAPDEFEKLEFLPEEPAPADYGPDDTGQIDFTPEIDPGGEPPVSFSPAADPSGGSDNPFADPADSDPDFGAGTPFELFGTSLFNDTDLDDDIDDLETDDLEF